MSSPVLSIVIPTYQEEQGLRPALERISGAVESLDMSCELLVVDDGSADRTWDMLKALCSHMPQLKALRLSRNFGKEYALCAGLEAARGDAVLLMDADLQHPPELIPDMVRMWRQEGYDVVDGVKRNRGSEPQLSRWFANSFYWLMGRISGYHFEGASDFKLLDRKVVEAWKMMPERNVFFRGMSAWLGFRHTTLSFDVAKRTTGKSSWSQVKLASLAVTGLVSFSSLPLRLVTVLGTIFFIAAIVLGIQTLYMKFAGIAVSGFTTVILLLLIAGSAVMISLGIIGEYIGRIYDEIKGRPRYVIADRAGWEKGEKDSGAPAKRGRRKKL